LREFNLHYDPRYSAAQAELNDVPAKDSPFKEFLQRVGNMMKVVSSTFLNIV
jgi:hypothetical protein